MKSVSALLICSISLFVFSQEVPSNQKGKVKVVKTKSSKKELNKNKNMSHIVITPAQKPVKK
jgi:hypothetical protein